MRAAHLLLCFTLIAGCAAQKSAPAPIAAEDPDAKQVKLLQDAALAVKSGMPEQAIDGALNLIISTFEQRWGHSERQVYCARTQVETIMYMGLALQQHRDAIAIGPAWAEAYKLKAYALVELGREAEAHAALDKALALSPDNAMYLEELGAMYEREKNWPKALEAFQHAESAAKAFSPPTTKDDELARALRGIAFVYVEQGRFDDAEQMYLRCLELNKNDSRAAAELRYVREQRARKVPR
jgi:tetratricopeptide (TPR) repeat protein